MAKAKIGDTVKIHYTGTLDNGKVFDSSEGKEPLEFKLGEKKVILGFENAVIDMEEGQEKDVKIPPDQAYGQPNENAIKSFPRESFPDNNKVKKGSMIGLTSPEGKKIFARILKVNDKEVKIDFNHPLAGKTLNFKIKLVKIN